MLVNSLAHIYSIYVYTFRYSVSLHGLDSRRTKLQPISLSKTKAVQKTKNQFSPSNWTKILRIFLKFFEKHILRKREFRPESRSYCEIPWRILFCGYIIRVAPHLFEIPRANKCDVRASGHVHNQHAIRRSRAHEHTPAYCMTRIYIYI